MNQLFKTLSAQVGEIKARKFLNMLVLTNQPTGLERFLHAEVRPESLVISNCARCGARYRRSRNYSGKRLCMDCINQLQRKKLASLPALRKRWGRY